MKNAKKKVNNLTKAIAAASVGLTFLLEGCVIPGPRVIYQQPPAQAMTYSGPVVVQSSPVILEEPVYIRPAFPIFYPFGWGGHGGYYHGRHHGFSGGHRGH
jgi:hypothetical protein